MFSPVVPSLYAPAITWQETYWEGMGLLNPALVRGNLDYAKKYIQLPFMGGRYHSVPNVTSPNVSFSLGTVVEEIGIMVCGSSGTSPDANTIGPSTASANIALCWSPPTTSTGGVPTAPTFGQYPDGHTSFNPSTDTANKAAGVGPVFLLHAPVDLSTLTGSVQKVVRPSWDTSHLDAGSNSNPRYNNVIPAGGKLWLFCDTDLRTDATLGNIVLRVRFREQLA